MNDMLDFAIWGGMRWYNHHDSYKDFWYSELEAHKIVHTSHMMYTHLDGFPVNSEVWDPKWLEYDYIGAPWPEGWQPYRVGNGGFSLRTKKLAARLEELSQGQTDIVNDILVSVTHRKQLEREGFKFAPIAEAAKFSVEFAVAETPKKTFGFHGYWPDPTQTPPPYFTLSGCMIPKPDAKIDSWDFFCKTKK
jgi:hypothetical protein